ncbi:hypothetical protein N7G274_002120 [Stereocaulon virgatum]|uniref:Protein kinase domain-containing protein n=1 Tax=Stereocaulon virgatum TaxID=373712 RepID=A0ABR4AKH5_9LECA
MAGLPNPAPYTKQSWLPLTPPNTIPALAPMARPALAELPALPMAQRPKPTTLKTRPASNPRLSENEPFTPPATPAKLQNKRSSFSADHISPLKSIAVDSGAKPAEVLDFAAKQAKEKTFDEQNTEPKPYTKEYNLHEELGFGVWSTVYRASEIPEPAVGSPPSPPESPLDRPIPDSKKVIAVKKPHRRDAHKILESEARILTYLHSNQDASNYLVPFHGWDATTHSLILSAIPLNLESHTRSAKQVPLTTKTMFDPIIGALEWADLAENLISGLLFLHSHSCVHGDIKPANILLRPNHDDDSKYTPLYCDFSSSHIISSTTEPEEISAITTDYTSPELLSAIHHHHNNNNSKNTTTNNRAVATYSSDVFALAVTLLFAAIGESPYAGARMEIQKVGMAKEGLPLEFARKGEQASRVMRGRAVERALKGGLAKRVQERLSVAEWRDVMGEVVRGWRDGGWVRGG